MQSDIIVLGGGPAGMTAAIYCSLAGNKTTMFEKSICGGQMRNAEMIENYPGFCDISGTALSENMKMQVLKSNAEIKNDEIVQLRKDKDNVLCLTKNSAFTAKAVIVAVGSKRRKLGLEEEEKFIGRGISYCALCDGNFFRNKTVAVIGSGSSAASEALHLAEICSKVYIILRSEKMKCTDSLLKSITQHKNIEIINNSSVFKINGDTVVESIIIYNQVSKTYSTIYIKGLFISIGTVPCTENFSNFLSCDKNGYIITDKDFHTSVKGVFACGDCTTALHQITTATGSATYAATNACRYIKSDR